MKISANFATYNNKERNISLLQAVESIYDQVDLIRICANDHTCWTFPKFKDPDKKIEITIPELDYTDNGKIMFLQRNEYYFTCDDDIIYPDNYIEETIDWMGNNIPVGCFHGRVLNNTGNYENSYQLGGHFCYSYLNTTSCHRVDVPGTGVMCINTDLFCPDLLYKSKHKLMSDLVFGLECARNNVDIWVLPHKEGWIEPIKLKESICINTQKKNQSEHVGIVKQIMKLKGLL